VGVLDSNAKGCGGATRRAGEGVTVAPAGDGATGVAGCAGNLSGQAGATASSDQRANVLKSANPGVVICFQWIGVIIWMS
jgi:hypothetical protein